MISAEHDENFKAPCCSPGMLVNHEKKLKFHYRNIKNFADTNSVKKKKGPKKLNNKKQEK